VSAHRSTCRFPHSIQRANMVRVTMSQKNATNWRSTHDSQNPLCVSSGIHDSQLSRHRAPYQIAVHRPGTHFQALQFETSHIYLLVHGAMSGTLAKDTIPHSETQTLSALASAILRKSQTRSFLTNRQLWTILSLATCVGGCSSAGRALQSHCRGQGFESPQLHQLTLLSDHYKLCGAVAQLGARLNGIQKVRGSNPLSSTVRMVTSPRRKRRRGLAFCLPRPPRGNPLHHALDVEHTNRASDIGVLAFLGKHWDWIGKWRVDECAIAVYNAPGPLRRLELQSR
jgi:hypothetical protein